MRLIASGTVLATESSDPIDISDFEGGFFTILAVANGAATAVWRLETAVDEAQSAWVAASTERAPPPLAFGVSDVGQARTVSIRGYAMRIGWLGGVGGSLDYYVYYDNKRKHDESRY